MSSLWTPGGERPINTNPPAEPAQQPAGAGPGPELSPDQEEQARQMAHEMAEARAQLLEAPVAAVIANHAFGMYELAAIHITSDDPDMSEARLAVDAFGVVVEGLAGRLGEEIDTTLSEALQNIRMAFVQRTSDLKAQSSDQQAQSSDQGEASS